MKGKDVLPYSVTSGNVKKDEMLNTLCVGVFGESLQDLPRTVEELQAILQRGRFHNESQLQYANLEELAHESNAVRRNKSQDPL